MNRLFNIVAFSLIICALIAGLAGGYYGHYYWLQRFASIKEEPDVVKESDFKISNQRYVFRKQPLPVAEVEVENPSESDDASLPSEEIPDDTADAPVESTNESGTAENEALRLNVQRALDEMKDK